MSTVMYDANDKYPFAEISLANPHGIQGGAFFSKIQLKNESPFLFQTPKCLTKNGIVHTDKKIYCDLVFSENNDIFINFLHELEKVIQHLIYEKRNLWFANDMEMENIEYFFNPLLRHWKKSLLVRTYVQQPRHIKAIKSIQIYDENENRLTIKDLSKDKKVIAIVEGLGIKFTSSSFHLELCLRQLMILEDKPIFNKCLIQMASQTINEHDDPDLCKMKYDQTSTKEQPQSIDAIIEKDNKNETTIEKSKIEKQQSDVKSKQIPINETIQSIDKKEIDKDKDGDKVVENKNDVPDNEVLKVPVENEEKEEDDDDDDNIESSFDFGSDIDTDDESQEDEEDNNKKQEDKINANIVNNNSSQQKGISKNEIIRTPSLGYTSERALEKNKEICEINVDLPENSESVRLKQPTQVYKEIYLQALEKAKEARRLAVQAFLEAKHIKNTFLAGEIDKSDDDLDTFQQEMK